MLQCQGPKRLKCQVASLASDLALACLTHQLAKDPNANQLHSSSSSLGVRHPQNKITCLASASLALTVRERPNVQACLYTKQPNASLQVEEGLSWVLANHPNNPNVTMALQHKIRTKVLFSKNGSIHFDPIFVPNIFS